MTTSIPSPPLSREEKVAWRVAFEENPDFRRLAPTAGSQVRIRAWRVGRVRAIGVFAPETTYDFTVNDIYFVGTARTEYAIRDLRDARRMARVFVDVFGLVEVADEESLRRE